MNLYSAVVYNSAVMGFWPILLKQRIKLVLKTNRKGLGDPATVI